MDVKDKRTLRTEIMLWLYKETDGDESVFIDMSRFMENDQYYDDATVRAAIQYLEKENLLKPIWTFGPALPNCQILHAGVVEVESGNADRSRPTTHLVPMESINIINVGGNFNAENFQQGKEQIQNSGNLLTNELTAANEVVHVLECLLKVNEFEQSRRVELEQLLVAIKNELSSNSPKKIKLNKLFVTVRDYFLVLAGESALHLALQAWFGW